MRLENSGAGGGGGGELPTALRFVRMNILVKFISFSHMVWPIFLIFLKS